MMEFTPSRLTLARRRRALTRVELARSIGISRELLTKIELGDETPSERVIKQLALALAFPVAFFGAGEADLLISGEGGGHRGAVASFRSLRALRARDRDAALAAGEMAMLIVHELSQRFMLPAARPPDLGGEQPERAADLLRQELRLGSGPIRNVAHLLEAMGVRLFWLAEAAREVDAFCFWNRSDPYVVLSTAKSPERGRMDAGHEAGHLILHRDAEVCGERAEKEANEFASALLMPRDAMMHELPRSPALDRLIPIKTRWGVSIAALVRRGFEVGVWSEWQYKSAFIELSKRGWRTNEPASGVREESQVLAKVFSALARKGITVEDFAANIYLNPADVWDILPLSRAPHAPASTDHSVGRRAHLRLVT